MSPGRNERYWAGIGHSGLLCQKTIHFCSGSNFPVSWSLGLLNTLFICGDMTFAILCSIFVMLRRPLPWLCWAAEALLSTPNIITYSLSLPGCQAVSESMNCFQSSLLEEPAGSIENNKIWVLFRGAHLYSHLVMQCDETSEFWTAFWLWYGHSIFNY